MSVFGMGSLSWKLQSYSIIIDYVEIPCFASTITLKVHLKENIHISTPVEITLGTTTYMLEQSFTCKYVMFSRNYNHCVLMQVGLTCVITKNRQKAKS